MIKKLDTTLFFIIFTSMCIGSEVLDKICKAESPIGLLKSIGLFATILCLSIIFTKILGKFVRFDNHSSGS